MSSKVVNAIGEQPGQQWREKRGELSGIHHRSEETKRAPTKHLAFLDIYFLITDIASESRHTFTMPTPPTQLFLGTGQANHTNDVNICDLNSQWTWIHFRGISWCWDRGSAPSRTVDCNMWRRPHWAFPLLTSILGVRTKCANSTVLRFIPSGLSVRK